MTFYVVKGRPDACGRGCDRWIVAEGQIDAGAAPRFGKFLRQVPDRKLPVYFASPGGNLDQALAMGAMLRERSVVARVARTLVQECGFEAQDSDVCLRLKASGRELHGDLFTRGAICASACPYLILGAAVREIAPDTVLGVHSPKVVTLFSGTPTPEMRAAVTKRGHDRADQMLTGYITKMGGDLGLLRLADSVKFESMHILTRDEIARFGIDKRDHVETPWLFEVGSRSMVQKIVAEKSEADKPFRLIGWRLTCYDRDRFGLEFRRPVAASSVFSSIQLSLGAAKPVFLTSISVKAQGFEFWGTQLRKAALLSLSNAPQFEFTEAPGPDGVGSAHTGRISNEGLAPALDSLLATCAAPAMALTAGARDDVAK